MGLLRKPYEISYWEDVWQEASGSMPAKYVEKRIFTIGSDTMDYQARAIEPVLTRKTNGEVNFSFKMYYQYIDNVTGETVKNPFTDRLKNESKIKLNYNGEWFDLLIKNINKDSATKSYTYQLVDQHMVELSKNGFDVTLDSSLTNNLGTANELATKVLADTDWEVESEKIVATQDEALVMLTMPSNPLDLFGITIYQINDGDLSKNGATFVALTKEQQIEMAGKQIYAFYSSCSGDKPYRFQFIYFTETPEIQSDRIITTRNCQYFIDGIDKATGWYVSGNFTIPNNFAIDTRENTPEIGNRSSISTLYRGRRYVYSQTSEYHPGIDMYLEKYWGTPDRIYDAYIVRSGANIKNQWSKWGEIGREDDWSYGVVISKDYPRYPIGAIVKITHEECSEPIYVQVLNNKVAIDGSENWFRGRVIDMKTTGKIQYYKYAKTNYVTPNLIQNVVNNAEFKGTSAWKGSKFLADGDADIGGKPASSPEFSATVESVSMKMPVSGQNNSLTNAIDAMLNGQAVIGDTDYKPYLLCGNLHYENDGGITKVIINSSTSDTAAFQQGITEGEKYHLVLKSHLIRKRTLFNSDGAFNRTQYQMDWNGKPTDITAQVTIGNYEYKNTLNGYGSSELPDSFDGILYNSGEIELDVAKDIEAKKTVTPEDMKKDNYQIFLRFSNVPEDMGAPQQLLGEELVKDEYFILIEKIQFYKLYPKENGDHYTPDEDLSATEVGYIVEDRYFPIVENDTRTLDEITFASVTNVFTPVLSANGARKSCVNAKESNYFNIIQSIAQTFECWPKIEVNHDSNGYIIPFEEYKDNNSKKNTGKRIYFYNYVGQPNHVGFKYGVNSKDIKRIIDSNQIVSKLIVKANSNEYAPNGFCSIARAPANDTKDNVIYNFGYYANQKLIDALTLQRDLYIAETDCITKLTDGLDIATKITEANVNNYLASCSGYYPKIRLINAQLESLSKLISENSAPLNEEIAKHDTYKAMYESATTDLAEQQSRFYKLAGFAYNNIPATEKENVLKSTTLYPILQTIAELASTEQDARSKYQTALSNKTSYETALSGLEIKYDNALFLKTTLNKLFYTRYSRFIQEGTWIDESYIDESLYYNDALSVSYNSSMPKVTYSMNVLSLAGLPGYELFDFKIGDQTFVEDVEFFGYDTQGNPVREKITITETSENLDDPTKNTIKIRNYENQFEDLFQRITATVQSVQYTEGSYKKASALAEADAAHKFSFLNDALSSAEARIGDANNTVVVDTSGGTGITITNKNNAEEALRLTSGAILLKGTDPNSDKKIWKTGLTAQGISASLITAGTVNTSEIQIMNGNEPTFRWDSHGITAYDFDNSVSDTYLSINKNKGVRFDRFGIYGYSGIDGETWKPTGISTGSNSIDEHSAFSLTWEGLKVTVNDGATLRIGDIPTETSVVTETENNSTAEVDDDSQYIFIVRDKNNNPTFRIKKDGSVAMGDIPADGDNDNNDENGGDGDGTGGISTKYLPKVSEDGEFGWAFDPYTGIKLTNKIDETYQTVFQIGNLGSQNNSNYGLYLNGEINATSGNIGPLFIKDGKSRTIFDSSNLEGKWSSSHTHIGCNEEEGVLSITNNTTTEGWASTEGKYYFPVYMGVTYEISFKAKKSGNLTSGEIYISDHTLEEQEPLKTICRQTIPLTESDTWKTFKYQFTPSASYNDCYIRFDNNGKQANTDTASTLQISNIQLTRISTGAEGLFMWNGPQSNGNTEPIPEQYFNPTGTMADWSQNLHEITGLTPETDYIVEFDLSLDKVGEVTAVVEGTSSNTAQFLKVPAQQLTHCKFAVKTTSSTTVDIYTKGDKDNQLTYEYAITNGKIYKKANAADPNLIFKVGNDANGQPEIFIKGEIIAEKGAIGGWNINENAISQDSIALISGNILDNSIVSPGNPSPVRISAGYQSVARSEDIYLVLESNAGLVRENIYLSDRVSGSISDVECRGMVCQEDTAHQYENIKITDIGGGYYYIQGDHPKEQYDGPVNVWLKVTFIDLNYTNSKFRVLEDGSLYASAAEITGTINATGGSNIAGWTTDTDLFGKLTTQKATNAADFYDGKVIDNYYFGTGMDATPTRYGTSSNIFAIGALEKVGTTGLRGTWNQANFRVTGQGQLYAKNAEIAGVIEAVAGGSIAGWSIGTTEWKCYFEGEYTVNDVPSLYAKKLLAHAKLGGFWVNNYQEVYLTPFGIKYRVGTFNSSTAYENPPSNTSWGNWQYKGWDVLATNGRYIGQ